MQLYESGWHFRYCSHYHRLGKGELRWSTKHLIAELTDHVIEVLERRSRQWTGTKLKDFVDDAQSLKSTSTISLEATEADNVSSGEREEGVEEPSDPQDQQAALPEPGVDQSRKPRLGCDTSCWLKARALSVLPLEAALMNQQTPALHPVAQLYTPMTPSFMRLMLLC